MDKKDKAKELLVHYFRLAAKGQWNFDHDNQTEIESIIDFTLDVAFAESDARIRELESQIEDLNESVRILFSRPSQE